MHGPVLDTLLGWCWLPIAVVVHRAESDVQSVQALVGIVFLISFAHQPLTLGLVYGDPAQRAAHRLLYAFAPFLAAALVLAGLHMSLTLVALVAALWNAEHTLMQRYGVMRIYGRKAGDTLGGLEKPMLIVWLVAGLAYIGAFVNLDELVWKLGVDGTNASGIRMLRHLHTVAAVVFWVAAAVGVWMAVRWWRAERSRPQGASRAKVMYAFGTAGLVVAVMVDPIAGVAGYVAAHAIEYFAIVHGSLRTRRDDAPVAALTRSRTRRSLVYIAYFVVVGTFILLTMGRMGGQVYAFAILFFGALHILYDGFVWKLRRPAVAASLGIVAPAPA